MELDPDAVTLLYGRGRAAPLRYRAGGRFLARHEGPTAIVAVLPSDHPFLTGSSLRSFRQAGETAKNELVTFGITTLSGPVTAISAAATGWTVTLSR